MTRKLCTYSRSDLLASEVLSECPIELTKAEHDHCPCRRREMVTVGRVEVRVLTCTYPRLWNGQEIMNPPVFAESTRRRIAEKMEVERLMSQQKRPPTSAVATADPAPAIGDPPIPDAEITAMVPATPAPGQGQLAEVVEGEAKLPAPVNLAAALARAQRKCKPVKKDARNSHHGYSYASAEAVIAEAKLALADTGLALVPIEQSLERIEGGYELVRRFLLIHDSGQTLTLSCAWPVIEERGRPVDKATAIASTASLSYMLRDLLLMPRVSGEADLAGRKDGTPPVSARAMAEQKKREQEAAQQNAPPASAGAPPASEKAAGPVTAQQLEKLASLRLASISTLKPADPEAWWREHLGRYSVTTARALGEEEARKLIGELAHVLNCEDMEAGLGESTGRT